MSHCSREAHLTLINSAGQWVFGVNLAGARARRVVASFAHEIGES